MSFPATLLRPSRPDDASALAAIYGHHVLHGSGTFELDPPDAAEMRRRHDAVCAGDMPWIVAEDAQGVVIGYAYASPFRPRPAYRYCLEDSIYIAPSAQGRGLGRWLLAELMARATAIGARQMVALIGDADNRASVALHAALGFEPTGVLRASGWKFGRWLDVVQMQKALGRGQHAPAPAAPPAPRTA